MSDVKVILAPNKTLRGSLAGGNTLKGGVSVGGGSKIELDTTLTQSGKAADAKAVGDALENVGGKAYVQNTQPANMEEGEFWYNPDEEPDAPGGAFDTYTKAEIDAIMGNYITDINNLVGGGA